MDRSVYQHNTIQYNTPPTLQYTWHVYKFRVNGPTLHTTVFFCLLMLQIHQSTSASGREEKLTFSLPILQNFSIDMSSCPFFRISTSICHHLHSCAFIWTEVHGISTRCRPSSVRNVSDILASRQLR